MDPFADLTDDEFVPFLNSLGVETYKKSFEWMLKDPNFGGILKWIYNNFDQNNALNAREEYRYTELQKSNKLLSSEELQEKLSEVLDEYPGLPLPGDTDSLKDIELGISFQKERLHYLKRENTTLESLIANNELAKQDLTTELSKLNAAQNNCGEDEARLKEVCLSLSHEVEEVTEEVVMVVANTLTLYGNCAVDVETSKKFLAFGPFEAYRQSQALFRSRFDLYCNRKLRKRQMDNVASDEETQTVLIEAKEIEDKLSYAIMTYVDAKAELSGELAKLALVENFENLHHSQILAASMEAKSAVEILEQEECIVDQQIQLAVKDFVDRRTKLVVDTAVKSALRVREEICLDLSWLQDTCQTALALDTVLYYLVRNELRTVGDLIQFAADLKDYLKEEEMAVASRIDSMNSICTEQEISFGSIKQQEPILKYLSQILGINQTNDVMTVVKSESNIRDEIKELKPNIQEGLRKKEMGIMEFKRSTLSMLNYIYDGCTKQPNARPRSISSLSHTLKQEMDRVEERVVEASGMFTNVKSGDKQNTRKLWQWFLTDQNKFMSIIKETQTKSFS